MVIVTITGTNISTFVNEVVTMVTRVGDEIWVGVGHCTTVLDKSKVGGVASIKDRFA